MTSLLLLRTEISFISNVHNRRSWLLSFLFSICKFDEYLFIMFFYLMMCHMPKTKYAQSSKIGLASQLCILFILIALYSYYNMSTIPWIIQIPK